MQILSARDVYDNGTIIVNISYRLGLQQSRDMLSWRQNNNAFLNEQKQKSND